MELDIKAKALDNFFKIKEERKLLLFELGKESLHKAMCRSHYPYHNIQKAINEMINSGIIENDSELAYVIFRFAFNFAIDLLEEKKEDELFQINKN